MKTIEEYAIDLVAGGAESVAEDDLNEGEEIAEDDHKAACDLAIDVAHAIRDNPQVALELVGRRTWAVPAEPGDDVTALMDAEGGEWVRHPDGGWTSEGGEIGSWHWPNLVEEFGPLTDATATTAAEAGAE